MAKIKRLTGAVAALATLTLGGAQAYYVRELTPGWPPQFHSHPDKAVEMVQIPLIRLQYVGVILVLAILCLIALMLGMHGRKR